MRGTHCDEPVSAVHRGAEHDIRAVGEGVVRPGDRTGRQAGHVGGDDCYRSAAEVVGDAVLEGIGKSSPSLQFYGCTGDERVERRALALSRDEQPDVVCFAPTGRDRVEEQGSL